MYGLGRIGLGSWLLRPGNTVVTQPEDPVDDTPYIAEHLVDHNGNRLVDHRGNQLITANGDYRLVDHNGNRLVDHRGNTLIAYQKNLNI